MNSAWNTVHPKRNPTTCRHFAATYSSWVPGSGSGAAEHVQQRPEQAAERGDDHEPPLHHRGLGGGVDVDGDERNCDRDLDEPQQHYPVENHCPPPTRGPAYRITEAKRRALPGGAVVRTRLHRSQSPVAYVTDATRRVQTTHDQLCGLDPEICGSRSSTTRSVRSRSRGRALGGVTLAECRQLGERWTPDLLRVTRQYRVLAGPRGDCPLPDQLPPRTR